MGNFADLKLFLVADGVAFPESEAPERDETNSVLVAATSPEGALRAADAFENGQVEAQDMEWQGRKVSVVILRDETGAYV